MVANLHSSSYDLFWLWVYVLEIQLILFTVQNYYLKYCREFVVPFFIVK